MPKASESGEKPVKATKAKSEKAGKTKPESAVKETKATKEAKTTKATKVAKEGDKPVAAKTPVKKEAASRTPAKKTGGGKVPALTQEQRRYYVEVAAYYIAERRGFGGGSQLEDWVQAETEIDRLLKEGILKP